MKFPLEPRYSLLTLAWLLGISWLSSLPDHGGPERSVPMQIAWNLAHIPLFGGLAFLVLKSLRPGKAGRARYWLASAVCMAFAVVDEWHQSFVPGRVSSIGDLLLDLAGVAAMLLVLRGLDPNGAVPPPPMPLNALGRPGGRT